MCGLVCGCVCGCTNSSVCSVCVCDQVHDACLPSPQRCTPLLVCLVGVSMGVHIYSGHVFVGMVQGRVLRVSLHLHRAL